MYYCMIPLGLAVGIIGTLIGAGGGFILVPILLFMFPQADPAVIATVSLAVVFFNATSGSIAYARMRRIHYPSAFLLTLACLPGAIAGALVVSMITRGVFAPIFGALLAAIAVFLLLQRAHPAAKATQVADGPMVPPYSRVLAVVVSIAVGFLASLLGIGGGIIHVPFLVRVLKFPAHVATATSHFVLAFVAAAGTIVHIIHGDFKSPTWVLITILLGAGVLVGAQLGARLSRRIHGVWIMRGLAIALLSASLRLILI